ncbi:MAG: ChbG/HpnK family deacetylase [Erysipelotrichaceae bacterium]|nr:ChbG/HpnK family deacetylase [Erysipelotrichaceae bacterium]
MRDKIDVHADDFAYSIQTSKDIIDCMKEGALDSFSIICNTKCFDRCMEMLYETIPVLPFLPKMSVHLDLPEGLSDSEKLPMSWTKLFLASYLPGRKKLKEEIKAELKKQIEKTKPVIDKCIALAEKHGVNCFQKGLRLDSHVHTHLIPVVADALTELLEESDYEVEYIRNPKEPIFPFVKAASLWPSYSFVNIIKNRILMFYSGKIDSYCQKHALPENYMWGLMMSGHMDIERIRKLFPEMVKTSEKGGRNLEILLHPGKAGFDEYSDEMNPDYFREFNSSENRAIEKEAVLSIRKVLDEYYERNR